MPEIIILPQDSEQQPKLLRKRFNELAEANSNLIKLRRVAERQNKPMPPGSQQENLVPWVQVGNLYLSVFETGDNSWKPIVTKLTGGQQAAERFTILTGRHGSTINHTGDGGQFTGIKDDKHLVEDLQKISELKEILPSNVDMMVLDVTDPDFNTERRLRECIRQHLGAGRVVILAWCFSIYAMKGVPEDATMDDIISKYPALCSGELTIKQIVQDDWMPV